MKEQTQKIYNQEYEEVVAQIKNTLNLSDESPVISDGAHLPLTTRKLYSLLLCSGNNGVSLEPPLSCMPEPGNLTLDGARALVDLSWSQRAPQVQPDDIDKDPKILAVPVPGG